MRISKYLFFTFILTVIVLVVCPFFGLSIISPTAVFDFGSPDSDIFWRIRVPRTVCAFLSGAGLSVSGMIFQSMFRNPLATPYTLGVSSGAAFGASVYFKFGTAITLLGSVGSLSFALLGGAISMLCVYSIARAKGNFSTFVLLLSGVIMSFFFSSLVMFIQYLCNANESMRIVRWMMGSITIIEPVRIIDLFLVVVLGTLILRNITFELDLLSTGEELAASRGVDVHRIKLIAFVATGAIVAMIVSITGPIGFVGMMVPHSCRFIFGWSHRNLLPAVFLVGGSFLVLCDLFARIILAPSEIPVGIITSMIGAPFFLWTLCKNHYRETF